MSSPRSSHARLLTFQVGEQDFAVRANLVEEITQMPRLSVVPHAPSALLGLANLRGSVLPVLSLGVLLGGETSAARRLIVVEAGERIGLAVTGVTEMAAGREGDALREIDVAELIGSIIPAKPAIRDRGTAGRELGAEPAADAESMLAFIAFAVGGQEFALPLSAVDEVMPLPESIALIPHSDEVVAGSIALRGALLPLMSLRALLALPETGTASRPRVVVVRIGTQRVGLVVDAMRSILRIAESALDPLPPSLTRGQAETRIQAIGRIDGGKRLVSVLSADQLLRDDITGRLLQIGVKEEDAMKEKGQGGGAEQFLLFRIGEQEFGLPIAAVEEVAPLPSKLTPLPKAPAFVKGVINLRGKILPVIDQAMRFGGEPAYAAKRRIVVMRIDDLEAGFIVDDVAEVIRVESAALRPAPELGSDDLRVFERVANLAEEDRIILIVSPAELLSRAEQDLLRALGERGPAARA